jgi:hypothetical protein
MHSKFNIPHSKAMYVLFIRIQTSCSYWLVLTYFVSYWLTFTFYIMNMFGGKSVKLCIQSIS